MSHDTPGTLELCNVSLHTLARNKKVATILVLAVTLAFVLHINISLSWYPCRVPLEDGATLKKISPNVSSIPLWSRNKVIILSYMRSGSTLCGDILQAHPDVFYVYEPLLYLWDYHVPYKNVQGLSLRKRTKHYWRKNKPYLPEPLDFLDFMFGCNLTTYNVEFLTNIIHSQDFMAAGCYKTWQHVNIMVNVTQSCVDRLLRRCVDSRTIVQKVLRLTMAEAAVYLQRDPTIRIIHLLRDPRGILLSRIHFNKKLGGEMHKNYSSICQRIWDDLRVSREISTWYWGRILTIRYEDLAEDPLAVTTMLYRFVGLELLPEIKRYVHTITSSETFRSDGKVTAKKTSRKYPIKTAYNWRRELPYSLVREVDEACRNVLSVAGYVSYHTEEQLRDVSIATKLSVYGQGLMTIPSIR